MVQVRTAVLQSLFAFYITVLRLFLFKLGKINKMLYTGRYYKNYFETVEGGRGNITFIIRLNVTRNSEFNVIVIYKIFIIKYS